MTYTPVIHSARSEKAASALGLEVIFAGYYLVYSTNYYGKHFESLLSII